MPFSPFLDPLNAQWKHPTKESPVIEPNVDVRQLWPDLFSDLDAATADDIAETFASSAHEGWIANRADVEALVKFTMGELTEDEYTHYTAGV